MYSQQKCLEIATFERKIAQFGRIMAQNSPKTSKYPPILGIYAQNMDILMDVGP